MTARDDAKALVAGIKANADTLYAMLDAALPADPPPVVEPPPVEPPPVIDPPSDAPVVEVRRFVPNMARLVLFKEYHEASRYERWQRTTIIDTKEWRPRFWACDLASGGVVLKLLNTEYRLKIDGQLVATVTPAVDATWCDFVVPDVSAFKGWKECTIECDQEPASAPVPHWVHFGTVKVDDWMPVCTGSYDLTHGSTEYLSFKVPARFTPVAKPLKPRQIVPFSTPLDCRKLYRTRVLPPKEGNIFRPNIDKNGVWSTFNQQCYFWPDFVRKMPNNIALLDGPRGIGTGSFISHIFVDRHGGAYCANPWRIFRVALDGTVTTRCGYRHKGIHSRDNSTLELVGDWSAIPEDKRGFHELWGICFDSESTQTDQNAAPIGGEQPHFLANPPTLYAADSQNNRVLKITFSATSLTEEPKVTVLNDQLFDPWSLTVVGNEVIVTERGKHRIIALDKHTGAIARVILEGPDFAYVDVNRFVHARAGVTADQLAAAPVVCPEGIDYYDGWIYFGSSIQNAIRRVRLDGSGLEHIATPRRDGNSLFINLCVAKDNSFGPAGAVFASSWTVLNFGFPQAWVPNADGTWSGWRIQGQAYIYGGTGGFTDAVGYGTAVAVGQGRCYFGSVREGLDMITQALPGEAPVNASTYLAGAGEYNAAGYKLTHGEYGYGFFGFDLPSSPNIDAFLAVTQPG